jgi:PPE-repeat protein
MVTFGDSAANPPEVNYWTLMAGDHGASATAAAAGHQALADTLTTTMGLAQGNAAATAAGGWQGFGGVSMLANATEMTTVMSMAVAWLQESSMLAMQIVDAYTMALESMIPGEVCTTNRTTQTGLIHTNVIGQNTPAIIALEIEYMGHFWTQNASMMAAYQSVVSAALAALATPPPLNPAFANPAGPLAGVVQAGADAAAGSLQAGFQSVSQTASSAAPATQAPASAAGEGMSQAMSMPMQIAGQLGQFAGQVPQLLGQAPQLLSQAVQLPMGMLGPLANAAGGLGAAGAPVDAASTATLTQAGLSTGGAGLGGGGGIGGGGSGIVPSSFTRPASSFATPNAPKLPGGFSGATAAPEPVAGSASSGMGTGGLYGAPAAMGRDGAGSSSEKAPTRTMQLTARPAMDRGDRQRN